MTAIPHLITEHQLAAVQAAQRKLQEIAISIELLREWSALATMEAIRQEGRADAWGNSLDYWKAGAAAGRAVAYRRAVQILEKVMKEE